MILFGGRNSGEVELNYLLCDRKRFSYCSSNSNKCEFEVKVKMTFTIYQFLVHTRRFIIIVKSLGIKDDDINSVKLSRTVCSKN